VTSPSQNLLQINCACSFNNVKHVFDVLTLTVTSVLGRKHIYARTEALFHCFIQHHTTSELPYIIQTLKHTNLISYELSYPKMPLFRRRAAVPRRTAPRTAAVTTTRKPGLFYRLTHSRRAHPVSTAGTTTTTRHGTRTHRTHHTRRAPVATGVARKPTIGDKIHGMF
jgi:hypothetical protein